MEVVTGSSMPMLDDRKQTLIDSLEHPLQHEGFELADVVLSLYKHNATVRVFVYGPNGVTIDDCARLSRVVGAVIDGLDMFADGYALEVSSPGLDRPLKTARDFRFRIGETVRVQFADKKRKNMTARITGISEGRVDFEDTSGSVSIDLAEIEKATIVF